MTPKLSTLRECATERVRRPVRFGMRALGGYLARLFWRNLWTLSVRLSGPSKFTLAIEGRYERALLADGRWIVFIASGQRERLARGTP